MESVASFAEAWIEIVVPTVTTQIPSRSPPSRRRGLKYPKFSPSFSQIQRVASFAEAWIEITDVPNHYMLLVSPPSRRRGLKLALPTNLAPSCVASFAEAWIEITKKLLSGRINGRLLRGGVD